MFFCILVISIRPIISTSTGPIFTKSAGLVELWPWMNDLKLFFRSLKGCFRGNQFCGQNRPPIHTLYYIWASHSAVPWAARVWNTRQTLNVFEWNTKSLLYSIRKPVVANFMILQSFKIRQACICDKRFALVWVTELDNVSDSGDTLHCVTWCDMCMHYGRWYTVTQAKFASQHSFLCKRSIMAKSSKITIYLIKIVQLPETSFLGTSDPKPALRVLLNFWAICASGSGDEILKAFYQVSLSSFLGR